MHVAVAHSFAALISSWYNYALGSSALCQHMLLCFYTTIMHKIMPPRHKPCTWICKVACMWWAPSLPRFMWMGVCHVLTLEGRNQLTYKHMYHDAYECPWLERVKNKWTHWPLQLSANDIYTKSKTKVISDVTVVVNDVNLRDDLVLSLVSCMVTEVPVLASKVLKGYYGLVWLWWWKARDPSMW